MCGIFGGFDVNEINQLDILENLSIRGRDGYGVWTDSRVDKSEGNIKSIRNHLVPGFLGKLTIANSRAIPTTEFESGAGKDIKNQQPFIKDGWIVVHNGIISNDKELIKKHSLRPESKVDSAILPELFSMIGFEDGIKELKGSFSILAYNHSENCFYAAKNFTPLCFIKSGKKFIFASMKEMLPERFRIYATEISPYTIHKIDLKLDMHSSYSFLPNRNKKVLVICSSGIDSTTTAWIYKYLGYEVTLLHFLYGQAAENAESLCVNNLAEKLGVEVIYHDARPLFREFKNNSVLLNSKSPVKGNQMLDAESTFSYVPNRNAIFAMIAGGIAEMIGCDTVSFGGQQMDSVYPDNNPGFVNKVSNLFPYSLNWNTNIKFTAPLIHLIKHEILAVGKYLNVPYEDTCSCYFPRINGGKVEFCNECGCCQFRIAAFKMLKEYSIKNPDDFIMKYIEPFV